MAQHACRNVGKQLTFFGTAVMIFLHFCATNKVRKLSLGFFMPEKFRVPLKNSNLIIAKSFNFFFSFFLY